MAECRVSDRLPVTRVGKVAARGRGVALGYLRNPSAQLPPRVALTFRALSVAFSNFIKNTRIKIFTHFAESVYVFSPPEEFWPPGGIEGAWAKVLGNGRRALVFLKVYAAAHQAA